MKSKPIVGILMGSDSDLPTMMEAAKIFDEFEIGYEIKVASAHRTPHIVADYASSAHERGLKVIVAGAGGAAHLPGVIAAFTPLPVIGVPILTKVMGGLDSLLSIVQMPGGVPVATVAVGGAKNAGLLAVQILGTGDAVIRDKMIDYKKKIAEESMKKNENLQIPSKS
jgi:5-(carboxyamino)imidazole ribonucleotide mutase